MTNIIEVDHIHFSYNRSKIIEDTSFVIEGGDFAALSGPNGSGKTTLVRLLLGLLTPQSGEIRFNSQSGNDRVDYSMVGYVPQLIDGGQKFPITVNEILSLAFYKEGKKAKKLTESQQERLKDGLRMVNLEGKQDEIFSNLSGGQKQRALIAKALISLPEILILDEPTSSIDAKSRQEFYELLYHLNRGHGMTILIISHELDQMKEMLTKILYLEEKKVITETPPWKF